MKRRSFLAGIGALGGLAMLTATLGPEPTATVGFEGDKLYSVGPGKDFATIQEAMDAMYSDQRTVAFEVRATPENKGLIQWANCF